MLSNSTSNPIIILAQGWLLTRDEVITNVLLPVEVLGVPYRVVEE
jgi:hypothetical protein